MTEATDVVHLDARPDRARLDAPSLLFGLGAPLLLAAFEWIKDESRPHIELQDRLAGALPWIWLALALGASALLLLPRLYDSSPELSWTIACLLGCAAVGASLAVAHTFAWVFFAAAAPADYPVLEGALGIAATIAVGGAAIFHARCAGDALMQASQSPRFGAFRSDDVHEPLGLRLRSAPLTLAFCWLVPFAFVVVIGPFFFDGSDMPTNAILGRVSGETLSAIGVQWLALFTWLIGGARLGEVRRVVAAVLWIGGLFAFLAGIWLVPLTITAFGVESSGLWRVIVIVPWAASIYFFREAKQAHRVRPIASRSQTVRSFGVALLIAVGPSIAYAAASFARGS